MRRARLPLSIEDFLSMDVKSGVKAATLNVGNKNYDLPLYEGTTGSEVVDVDFRRDLTRDFR